MILELPCLDKIFGYVVKCVQNKEPMAEFMTLLPLYGDPKHCDEAMTHRFGYFVQTIKALLADAGMREIELHEARYHYPFRDMRIQCIK